ncbi:hypothetical protein Smp_175290 [Schistosoma mansoni]|uniref:hypothetical protein n=1 Tax=Schistosoma mansoni TaxID=6183 RepID=UPI0001A62537|nr:hypothetical protein Smp_175290 [Schistosoma mansoni]|eukprot:XP_018646713.1 hypothetical protein Smp_175290 [Schistosoma mansoni]
MNYYLGLHELKQDYWQSQLNFSIDTIYRFVRQCVSRRDGQFRIYTGRASPIGECEIIFQLADHTEAVYVHEQFTRLMHQSSVNTPSSLSSSSSSSNSGWNRFGYSQNK